MLHIYYKGTIFVAEIKQNTNSTDPRRSLKSATKIMKNLFNTIDFEALNGNAVLDDGRTIDSARVEQAESDKAACLDKMSENEILVVFNDIPELTYEVWNRYKVGYHDYDVHQYEIGLKK